MARSTQRMPKSERRALVLATATDAFVAHGFRSTSMEDIARAVGVTKPVLYQHFDSKEALYLMVVEGVGARVLAAARSLPPLTGDTQERARGAIRRVQRLADDHLGVRLLLSEESVSRPVSALVSVFRTQLARTLAQALVHRPVLPDRTAVLLGRCLIALAAGDVLRPEGTGADGPEWTDPEGADPAATAADGTAAAGAGPPGPAGPSAAELDLLSRFVASGIAGLEEDSPAADGAHELV
ncbi:TetR/AcrR family transcriptional regulator [Brachybacterium sp. MASK1Z-5]|uniref:TetR/AcrR family transcriptional regulator n=1 Tax=Brachybacterium halotolerans TaxID=2795215 RepID=A0ABS1B8E6_9MICO|nr:TetR/AcrR family transcriptional regulator [Brachybacterium halotolerans]MBK0330462.1 TetR/AcrR family transcriptional regulator [Brachybacterium halotolerans]